MRLFQGRLQLRAATLVAIASVPLLLLSAASSLEHRRHLQDEVANRALVLVEDLGGEVERLAGSTRLVLTALSQVPTVEDRGAGVCSRFVRELLDDFPQFANLGAVTGEGRVYCSALQTEGTWEEPGPLEGRASQSAVELALTRNQFTLGEYGRGRATGRVLLPAALPFPAGDGVMFASMDLTWLGQSILESGTLPEGAVLAISGRDGTEVIHTPPDREALHLSHPTFTEAITARAEGSGTVRLRTSEGRQLVSYRHLPAGMGLESAVLSLSVPADVAYRAVGEGLVRDILLGTLLILLASGLAWTGAEALIRRPVGRLVGLARRLADGDLGARASMQDGEGELGELGGALNEMAAAIQSRESQLVEAQEALGASERRFRVIQEASPDAFVLTRAVRSEDGAFVDFEIVYANPAAEALLPPGMDTCVGRTLLDLNPMLRSDGRLDHFLEVMEHGKPLVMEVPLPGPRGEGVWMRISAVRIDDGLGIAYSDVTARKRLEEQLFQAQKLEAVGRLAGGVAHDFNNLLTVISGSTDLLLLDADNPETEEALSEIQQAAARAADLTKQLLAYSRRQVVQPQVVDLNGVIRELEILLRRLVGGRVGLHLELDPALGPVRVDPGSMGQVVMNLVLNARDAMVDGGTVVLRTTEEGVSEADLPNRPDILPGRYAILSVQDTGTGIPPAIRSRIFEPFFTTKQRDAGTGLGLSTVYGIVRQSGGHIEVDSHEGRGSTFRVWLPVMVNQGPGGAINEDRVDGSGASETVLVVEDDTHVRGLLQGILSRIGYRTLAARGAQEALLISRSHPGPINLLLTELAKPGLNGRALARELAAERPDLKVMFISSQTLPGPASQRGAVDAAVLGRPFTPDRVTRRVRSVLDGGQVTP